MDPMDSQHVEGFRKALEAWTDSRFISAEQIETLAMFHLYLVNIAEADGWAYAGHSVKVGTPMCCLTVKSWHGDIPMVVFTNAQTTTACIRIFMRKLQGGFLEWRPDKYRG